MLAVMAMFYGLSKLASSGNFKADDSLLAFLGKGKDAG